MKIASVKAIPLTAPLDPEAQRTAFGSRANAALVLVEVCSSDGLVGYGEALARFSLRSYVSLIEDLLAPIVVGQNPFETERLWQQMLRVFPGSRPGGVLMEAIAAIDIALWDLMGKAVNQPVHRLLGSMGRTKVAAYASSISWASDEIAIRQAEAAVGYGFTMIKVKIASPVERALARATLIRKVVGSDVDLCADANWSFDFDDAIRVGRGLANLNYYWLEEPLIVDDHEGYHRLRPQLPIRLAAGESEHTLFGCRDLLSHGSVGVIQPNVTRSGGITETRRIGMLGYAFNVPFAPHMGFSGVVCAAASLQLSAALPNFLTFECMTFPNPLREELSTNRVGDPRDLIEGSLLVPTGPGLGVDLDSRSIERFRLA